MAGITVASTLEWSNPQEQIGYDTTTGYQKAIGWTATETFDIATFKIGLSKVGSPTGTIKVEIWDDASGSPGTIITNGTSGTIDVSTLVQTTGVIADTKHDTVEFTWATPPTLTDTNVYYFVIKHSWEGSESITDYCLIARRGTTSASGWSAWRIYADDSENSFTSVFWCIIQKDGTPTFPQFEGYGGLAAETNYSVAVPYPLNVEADDILFVTVGDADDDDFDTPSGWTQVAEFTTDANFSCALYWKRAVGTESGTVTFTSTKLAGTVVGGMMWRFSNCRATGDPFDSFGSSGITLGTPISSSEITTAEANTLVLWFTCVEDNLTTSGPDPFVEAGESVTNTGSDMGFVCSMLEQATAGVVAADTAFLWGSDYWGSFTLDLVPATATTWGLAGTIAAQSTVTGDLKRDVKLAGTVAAASTVTGDLDVTRKLAGSIDATSTVTGNLGAPQQIHLLAGAIAATSTVAGDVKPRRKLAGSIFAQAAAVGTLVLTQALVGSVAAQSTVTGNLEIIQASWSLQGSIAAASTATADLKATRKLSGSVAAVSSVVGDLTQVEASWSLQGSVAATSALSGTLALDQKIAGAIEAQSTLIGDLVIVEAQHVLAGSIDATSTVTADLRVTRQLAGAIEAVSSVIGDLAMVEASWSLAGSIDATSTVSGTLTLNQKVAGAIEAKSSLVGDLVITQATQILDGTIAAQSSLAGDLKPLRELAGSISAQSSVSGDLKVGRELSGQIAALSDLTGDLLVSRELSGAIAAQSSVAGTLTLEQRLVGQIAAQSILYGQLVLDDAAWPLGGDIAAQATLVGDLKPTKKMVGQI